MSLQCPACEGILEQKSSWLQVCRKCGLYRSNLEPGPGKAFEGIEALRRLNFEDILDSVEKIRPLSGARLIEIGCAKGWFLEAARRRGALVAGVEPVSSDARQARSFGHDVEEGLFPASPTDKGPYDVIVFNDVFEHLPDPAQAARACEGLLSPDGLLVINIPSSKGPIFHVASILNKVGIPGPYDRLWQKGLPSPHVTYFSPDNLRALVEKQTGLRRIITQPLLSLHRNGLRKRIDSSSTGMPSFAVFAAAWTLSFVLPLFPSDIELAVFAKSPAT